MTDNIMTAAELICRAAAEGKLKKAVFSKAEDRSIIKTVATVKRIAGREMLQLESFLTDGKAIQKNLQTDARDELFEVCRGYGQINIITTAGDAEYRRSKSGNSVIKGASALLLALQSCTETVLAGGNDREKNYILSGDEPFLKLLGISDKNGRIHDKKQGKFRQICRFLEFVRDIEPELPREGRLVICDLCCGKSYLSFAVYHYFAVIRGRDVMMTGVDLKRDVVDYCNGVSGALGFTGLKFIAGDVTEYKPEAHPSLVVSLHACDVATDIVLGLAAAWRSEVILSTPCCHRDISSRLSSPELKFVSEHPMLRRKLCDSLTDALRLKLLSAEGYSVSACELVDPDDTPKNILLRAILDKKYDKTSPEAARRMEEYHSICRFLIGEENHTKFIFNAEVDGK